MTAIPLHLPYRSAMGQAIPEDAGWSAAAYLNGISTCSIILPDHIESVIAYDHGSSSFGFCLVMTHHNSGSQQLGEADQAAHWICSRSLPKPMLSGQSQTSPPRDLDFRHLLSQ